MACLGTERKLHWEAEVWGRKLPETGLSRSRDTLFPIRAEDGMSFCVRIGRGQREVTAQPQDLDKMEGEGRCGWSAPRGCLRLESSWREHQ